MIGKQKNKKMKNNEKDEEGEIEVRVYIIRIIFFMNQTKKNV